MIKYISKPKFPANADFITYAGTKIHTNFKNKLDMKKNILVILVLLVAMQVCATDFFVCKVFLNDSTVVAGISRKPYMMDKYFKLLNKKGETEHQFPSDQVKYILFYDDNHNATCYEPVLTYKNYSNKKGSKSKSWLQIVSSGYVKLYYGYQPDMNSKNKNLWYCKKAGDTIAYFITMEYSDGAVPATDPNNELIKNASVYFADYPALVEKIKQNQFKIGNLTLLVEEYNAWKGVSE